MTALNIILLLVALTLLVVVFKQARLLWQEIRRHRSAAHKTTKEDERILQSRIAKKAAAAVRTEREEHPDLSESGAMSINDEIDRCIQNRNWDEAVKWAEHAIQSRPHHVEFKVKLAEVYYRAGYRDEFMELFEKLQQTLGEEHDLRARLSTMAREIAPDQNPGPR